MSDTTTCPKCGMDITNMETDHRLFRCTGVARWQREVILRNVQADPHYAPYCLRCSGLVRMCMERAHRASNPERFAGKQIPACGPKLLEPNPNISVPFVFP